MQNLKNTKKALLIVLAIQLSIKNQVNRFTGYHLQYTDCCCKLKETDRWIKNKTNNSVQLFTRPLNNLSSAQEGYTQNNLVIRYVNINLTTWRTCSAKCITGGYLQSVYSKQLVLYCDNHNRVRHAYKISIRTRQKGTRAGNQNVLDQI